MGGLVDKLYTLTRVGGDFEIAHHDPGNGDMLVDREWSRNRERWPVVERANDWLNLSKCPKRSDSRLQHAYSCGGWGTKFASSAAKSH